MTTSMKVKLLAAALLVLLLAAFSQRSGMSAATAARAVLGVAAVGAFALWLFRARRAGGSNEASPFQLAPRLTIAARTGLTARTGLALVEADGRRYLVAYGDGFAQVLNAMPPRAPLHARSGHRLPPRRGRNGGRP